ncbi:MAG: penicillin-binding protein 1B [Chromatiales bacterium]|jgi:penicillin-binding protein 1B
MPRKKTGSRKTVRKKVIRKKTSSTGNSRRSIARRKKPQSKKRRRARRSSGGFLAHWKKILLLLFLVGGIGLGAYSLYLSHVVSIKFEGKRWAVPARVYGRPLELYAGAPVGRQQLEAELQRLGYRQQQQPQAEGSWGQSSDGAYLINTRAFEFWDESTPAESLQISFNGDRITQIRERRSGQEKALLRLEAPMIESIYPSHNEDRILLKREQLPPLLVMALVAVEDREFYEHHGVNPKSIARALLANIRAGHVVQGGSTLTQQLVKNFFLSSERSLVRKFNEALMALIVDARYQKDEILEAYANEIYLGQDAQRAIHGFGLASRFYFNRPLAELDLPRIALLVGMIKGPSWYDPRKHPKRARERRDLVLDLMQQQGIINASQATKAKAAPLGINRSGRGSQRSYPAFIKLVRKQLQRDYREQDLTSQGLRIFTTLDPWIQEQAEKKAAAKLTALEQQHGLPADKLQLAVVIANPQSGELYAVLGARDADYAGFNRALDALRPVGSLIKPVVYLSALMQPQKYTLMTQVPDQKIRLQLDNGDIWQPENFDKQEHGDVTILTALAKSYNLATVQLGLDVGLPAVIDTLRKTGVTRPLRPYPSLLLGAISLSPLEVTQIYQTFAAGGFRSPLRAIQEVLDSNNQPLQRYPLTVDQTLPAAPVYLLDRALQSVVSSGTALGLQQQLSADLQLAGKTGTTDDLRDSWFAGFSNNLVTVVWVGRDDNQPAGLTGSRGAMHVWGNVMQGLSVTPLALTPPADIETVWIDQDNGLLASEQCEHAVQMEFVRGSAPQLESSCIEKSMGFFDRLFR